MRPAGFIPAVLLFAAATSAWPSGWDPYHVAKREIAPLIARQNGNGNGNNNGDGTASADQTSTAKEGNTASTEKATKETGNPDKTTVTASSSDGKNTDDGKTKTKSGDDGDKTTEKTAYETTKTFDARKPAGGVSMVTPGPLDPSQYYKIADYVTFAWNYTSLSITPSAVDILASCSRNSATYTIALNQSITAATQAVTWDTGEYQSTATIPLLVETYTLIIYDSDSSPDADARAGYLAAYNQFTFGMYTPQAFTPRSEFVCATCNGAMTAMEKHTLGFLFGMAALTVLSFSWFTGVAGLW